jgi:hypothetical protein
MSQFEQLENIKFCPPKLCKSASKMFQMIRQVYSEEALGRSAMRKRHKSFANGRVSLNDDEHRAAKNNPN